MFKVIFIVIFSVISLLNAKSISIVGTADLQGVLEPSLQRFDSDGDGIKEEMMLGGIAHLSTLYKKLQKDNPNTIIISTGDDLMSRYFHLYKGKVIFSLMSDAGYQLYALGNHEFDKGTQTLAKALKSSRFTTICSDLDVSHSDIDGLCLPYLIKDIDGVRVGFFSLMSEDLSLVTSQREVTLISDNLLSAQNMVKLLKSKNVNIIVLLSHIGYKKDIAIAKQVEGIDVIFGGHSHEYIQKIGRIHKTVIVNGGEKGKQVIKVDIPLNKELRPITKSITMTKILVTKEYKADPQIAKKLQKYKDGFPTAIVLGVTKTPWELTSATIRKGESNVANLINDMMKKKFGVDIVLNNAGAFRGSKIYKEGNITDTMLKEIDEFGNYAYIINIQGKYIKEILERSASSYKEGGLMHPSGLKYRIRLSKQKQQLKDGNITQKGNRVEDIMIKQNSKWVAIDKQKIYKVLSNSFIVKHQGDGYFWFKRYGTNPKNTYSTFYSIISEFLNQSKELSPKPKDGRLKIYIL